MHVTPEKQILWDKPGLVTVPPERPQVVTPGGLNPDAVR
jgi:hypothetical protein